MESNPAFGTCVRFGGGTSEQGPPPPRPHRQEKEARSLLWPSITRNQGLPGIVLSMIWGQIIVIWELIWLSMCLFGPHSPPCLQEPGFPVLLETPKPGPFLLPWGLAISLLPPCPLPVEFRRTHQPIKGIPAALRRPFPCKHGCSSTPGCGGNEPWSGQGGHESERQTGVGERAGSVGTWACEVEDNDINCKAREREEPRPDLFVPSLRFDDSIHLLFPSPFSFYWGAAPLLFEDCPRMPSQHSHSSCPCLRTRVPLCLSSANAVSN